MRIFDCARCLTWYSAATFHFIFISSLKYLLHILKNNIDLISKCITAHKYFMTLVPYSPKFYASSPFLYTSQMFVLFTAKMHSGMYFILLSLHFQVANCTHISAPRVSHIKSLFNDILCRKVFSFLFSTKMNWRKNGNVTHKMYHSSTWTLQNKEWSWIPLT